LTWAVLILVVLVGGYLFLNNERTDEEDLKDEVAEMAMEDSHEHEDGEGHSHEELVVDGEAPTVDFTIEKDSVGGWNVHILTENFVFTPENVNEEYVDGEGHAHIYVDGEKIARVYNDWYHIGALEDGEREVRVELNSNNHNPYGEGGVVVEKTIILEVVK